MAPSLVQALRDEANRGTNPLGLTYGSDDLTIVLEALDGVDAATAALVAEAAATHASNWRKVHLDGELPMDPLLAGIIHDLGIDPLVATYLGLVSGIADLDDADTGHLVVRVDGMKTVGADGGQSGVFIGTGLWRQAGVLELDAIPHTVAAAAVGRDLSSLVSHPLLDEHGLTIIAVDPDDEGRCVIRTSHQPRPATLEELIALGPCGCR